MLQRESGWRFDESQADLWDVVETGRGRLFVAPCVCPVATKANSYCSFINRVSDAHQVEEPDQFYGGIIADPMGFGKTLTMIALAATDYDIPHSPTFSNLSIRNEAMETPDYTSPQTLIIVPPSRMYFIPQCCQGGAASDIWIQSLSHGKNSCLSPYLHFEPHHLTI